MFPIGVWLLFPILHKFIVTQKTKLSILFCLEFTSWDSTYIVCRINDVSPKPPLSPIPTLRRNKYTLPGSSFSPPPRSARYLPGCCLGHHLRVIGSGMAGYQYCSTTFVRNWWVHTNPFGKVILKRIFWVCNYFFKIRRR